MEKIIGYTWIGRLNVKIAKAIGEKAADIYINDEDIFHIGLHKKELEKVGMSGLDYVKYIYKNFNQVRKGTDYSILLVVYNEKLSNIAALRLVYFGDGKKEKWRVTTAQPRGRGKLKNNKILWKK